MNGFAYFEKLWHGDLVQLEIVVAYAVDNHQSAQLVESRRAYIVDSAEYSTKSEALAARGRSESSAVNSTRGAGRRTESDRLTYLRYSQLAPTPVARAHKPLEYDAYLTTFFHKVTIRI